MRARVPSYTEITIDIADVMDEIEVDVDASDVLEYFTISDLLDEALLGDVLSWVFNQDLDDVVSETPTANLKALFDAIPAMEKLAILGQPTALTEDDFFGFFIEEGNADALVRNRTAREKLERALGRYHAALAAEEAK